MSGEISENGKCFLCKHEFEVGDEVIEFFGGYAHFSCFDKKMEENKKEDGKSKK